MIDLNISIILYDPLYGQYRFVSWSFFYSLPAAGAEIQLLYHMRVSKYRELSTCLFHTILSAVSYTHLDVYKRQLVESVFGKADHIVEYFLGYRLRYAVAYAACYLHIAVLVGLAVDEIFFFFQHDIHFFLGHGPAHQVGTAVAVAAQIPYLSLIHILTSLTGSAKRQSVSAAKKPRLCHSRVRQCLITVRQQLSFHPWLFRLLRPLKTHCSG